VRRPGEDDLVLPAGGLTLGGVDHHHRAQALPAGGVEDRLHLACEREPGTASTAQVDRVGEPDQVLDGQWAQVAVHLVVRPQVEPAELAEPRGQPGLPDAGDRRHEIGVHVH
jgi:hypothetical protein